MGERSAMNDLPAGTDRHEPEAWVVPSREKFYCAPFEVTDTIRGFGISYFTTLTLLSAFVRSSGYGLNDCDRGAQAAYHPG